MKRSPCYTKYSSGGTDCANEGAALRWLAEAEPKGGIHIAKVFSATSNTLVEERIQTTSPTPEAAEAIGRGLALMHAAGAQWFGQPPTSFSGEGYVIHHSRTNIVSDKRAAEESWGAYFAAMRIEPFVDTLLQKGLFSSAEKALFDQLCSLLRAGCFDAPQPKLVEQSIATSEIPQSINEPKEQQGLNVSKDLHNVESSDTRRYSHAERMTSGGISRLPITCARIHGDLWAGNVLYDANPNNATHGALIDPMAHGGHAETDLAMLQLFGFSYLEHVLGGYREGSPLTDGWQERVGLHQLAPLLHHCVLFGSSYVPQTVATCKQYL